MVLTNGHCLELGFPSPGEVIVSRASRRRFELLSPDGRTAGQVRAERILYATMTGTDMTLYRLRETFTQIESSMGVRPLTLANVRPEISIPVEVISGYWLTGFRCAVEALVHELREESYTMNQSIRYTRPGCEVYGGTSGAPILSPITREVVGVNNTGNESGGRCTMNNPCEIDEAGNVTYQKGYSYGQQTYWLYSCLNAVRELDLSQPGCLLPH
jgi:hypothetical protein